MDCHRCHGFMVEEIAHDFIDGLVTITQRCLNCGSVQFPAACCDMTMENAREVTR